MTTLAELTDARAELDRKIAALQKTEEVPGWMRFLAEYLGVGSRSEETARRFDLTREEQARLGRGAPSYIYASRHGISIGDGSSGPGMLAVLRALVALEEARIRGEIADEVRP